MDDVSGSSVTDFALVALPRVFLPTFGGPAAGAGAAAPGGPSSTSTIGSGVSSSASASPGSSGSAKKPSSPRSTAGATCASAGRAAGAGTDGSSWSGSTPVFWMQVSRDRKNSDSAFITDSDRMKSSTRFSTNCFCGSFRAKPMTFWPA